MRYYALHFYDPATGAEIGKGISSLTPQGVFDRGALNIEIDAPVVEMALPVGAAHVRLWGVSPEMIGQATDLNGRRVVIYGGMSKGLPLADPRQQGTIVQGVIFNAFGNWQGTMQTVEFQVVFDGGSIQNPKNIVLPWTAGMELSDAIQLTLQTAFPTYRSQINISQNLILSHDEPGYYQTIGQFAQYVKQVSQDIIGGAYRGVSIVIRDNTFLVYDGTTPTTPKPIVFTDLIGQPTWSSSFTVNFKTVMRGDLFVGDYVKMPPGRMTTTPKSFSQYRQGSAFQGVFQIDAVRHLGNFRQPDGNAWVTVFDAHLAG